MILKQKYVFRKLDHICIYLAIAGSYTPVALCVVQGWVGILILVIQWSAVLAGILLKAIAKRSFPVLSTTIYLVMGWIAIIFIPFLIHSSFWFLFFIVMGGIMYSVGVFFYAKHKKYFHFVWHLFINCASILHFIAIVFPHVIKTPGQSFSLSLGLFFFICFIKSIKYSFGNHFILIT